MKYPVMAALAAFLISLMALAPTAFAADNEKVAAELKAIIESGEPVIGNEDNDERIVEVYVFYGADRDFKPIWVRDDGPKAKAREALAVFKTAPDMGLDPGNYRVAEIEPRLMARTPRELAELELLMSRAFIDFGRDINRGRVTPKKASSENAIVAKEVGALTLIDGAEMADNIAEFVATLEPRSREYGRLKLALGVYRGIAATGGWQPIPKGPALKPGMRDGRVAALRARLEATGDLQDSGSAGEAYDPVLVEAVKKFQARNGLAADGIIAQTTLEELNVPVAQRVRQLELNLERRRWMDDNPGNQYVFVNIADQELKVVRGDRTVHTARVVVGKPYNRTPVFSETMKYIVLNPTWNVPASIVKKEYLPKLKKDPGLLERQGIKVVSGGGDGEGPIALRQESGSKNALGRVKFMFPNRFNVYLHDTPSKSLFDKDLRAFSHGCIRVQNPLDLAALLLGEQGWTRPKIDGVVASGKQRVINLKKQIPVHIAYLTAWVDKDGTVNFRRDVYGRDKSLAQALAGSLPASE